MRSLMRTLALTVVPAVALVGWSSPASAGQVTKTYSVVKNQKLSANPGTSFSICQGKNINVTQTGNYAWAEFISNGTDPLDTTEPDFHVNKGKYFFSACLSRQTGSKIYNYKLTSLLTNAAGTKTWQLPNHGFNIGQTAKYDWGTQLYPSPDVQQ